MSLTSEISSITEQLFLPKLVDNIFASNSLWQRWQKKRVNLQSGGTKIVQPLLYATTSAVSRYTGADTFTTAANDQITSAEWDWKQMQASITITRLDELKNGGKQQVVNFVKAKVQAAEKTMKNTIGTDLFADGSTANSIQGLALACAATGTYGNIAKGSYSWWQGSTSSTATILTVPVLQGGYGDVTIGNDKPTVAVTTQDLYDSYYGTLQPQQRFTDSETAKGGFSNLLFNGIPVIVDSHVSSGDWFFLNEDYFELIIHKDENFRFEPFIKPVNQNVSVAHIFLAYGLTCSNPRMQKYWSSMS